MRQEIVEKLNIFLRENRIFLTEKDCVYFMVQIRKLIEIYSWEKEFPITYFYCNWTVHPIIDRKSSIKLIASIWEEIEGKDYITGLRKMLNMDSFKKELSLFLKKSNLLSFTENVSDWKNFFRNLVNVLAEQKINLENYSQSRIKSIAYNTSPEFNHIHLDINYKTDEKGVNESITYIQ